MAYKYTNIGYDGATPIEVDALGDLPLEACTVCGKMFDADVIIATNHGEMCCECYNYLQDVGDDKPKIISDNS